MDSRLILKKLKAARVEKNYEEFSKIISCEKRVIIKTDVLLEEVFYYFFFKSSVYSALCTLRIMSRRKFKSSLHVEICRRCILRLYLNGDVKAVVDFYIYWISLKFEIFLVRELFWISRNAKLDMSYIKISLRSVLGEKDYLRALRYIVMRESSINKYYAKADIPSGCSRTCIIISGQLRAPLHTLAYYRKAFRFAPNPVFILSTWDELGVPRLERLFDIDDMKKNGIDVDSVDEGALEKINEYFNGLSTKNIDDKFLIKTVGSLDGIDLEPLPSSFSSGHLHGVSYPRFLKSTSKGSLAMFYKMARGWSRMEEFEAANNIKFDVVVRVRPDLIFNKPIPEKAFLEALTNQFVYTGEIFPGHCDDQFAIGSRYAMSIYSDTFKNLNRYWSEKEIDKHDSDLVRCNAEQVLFQHIDINMLDVRRYPYDKPKLFQFKVDYSLYQNIMGVI